MNNKCHIVRDLLPSYIDKICSKESRQFVEEHIDSCEECKKILDVMRTEFDIPDEQNKNERLEEKKPFKKLSNFFKAQKKLTIYVQAFALLSLVLGIFFLIQSVAEEKEYKKEVSDLATVDHEKEVIMDDVFSVLGSSEGVSDLEEQELLNIFDKNKDKLNYLAIFPASQLDEWLEENKSVRKEPTNIYPVDYQKATVVIGSEGVIDNQEQITPSDYDFGNVVMAGNEWVVQYEYRSSYESTIERHVQLKYYGPTIWNFYQLPILFFTLFAVLGLIWLILKKQNGKLDGVID